MFKNQSIISAIVAAGSTLMMASTATAVTLKITVENLAPQNGNFLTPVWVGFHDGGFDLYDRGAPASSALERLAEDGSTDPISDAFSLMGAGTLQGTIFGPNIPPIAPGETTSAIFTLNENLASSRYFSYASMIIPSNDAFIANGNPLAHQIFDGSGKFLGANFIVLGSQVLDAGTEVNDEIPANTAFLGQTVPDTGTPENGTVEIHPGFILGGSILSTPQFANADFKAAGYQVARIQVEKVPEPTAINSLLALSGLFLLGRRLRSERPD
jgi:hypothetical protein